MAEGSPPPKVTGTDHLLSLPRDLGLESPVKPAALLLGREEVKSHHQEGQRMHQWYTGRGVLSYTQRQQTC